MKMVSQTTSVAFELKILSSNGRAKRALNCFKGYFMTDLQTIVGILSIYIRGTKVVFKVNIRSVLDIFPEKKNIGYSYL